MTAARFKVSIRRTKAYMCLNVDDDDDSDKENEENSKVIDLAKYPFIVMQMESAWRLDGPPADLMIADECESDLAQFSSSTMKKLKQCSYKFRDCARRAGKVLFMDAFLSDKTLEFVRRTFMGEDKNILLRHNTWLPEGRKAFEIVGKSSADLKAQMTSAIKAKVAAGEKIVLFSANNMYAMEVTDILQEEFPEKTILLYNKYTSDAVKDEHFQNVDVIWRTADVVIYSPMLLAGVSFNVHDHFSCIFLFGYNKSCCVRDMMQAAGRVRKFKDNVMYYALDTFGLRSWTLPLTFEAVEASVISRGELNKKYMEHKEMMQGPDVDPHEEACRIDPRDDLLATLLSGVDLRDPAQLENFILKQERYKAHEIIRQAPDWLKNVHVRNVWESYLTHNPASYRQVFEDFLKLAGWQQSGVLTKNRYR